MNAAKSRFPILGAGRLCAHVARRGGRSLHYEYNAALNKQSELPLDSEADAFVRPEKRAGTLASYPALRLTQNNQLFFFVTMPVADIFPYCYVISRTDDPIKGFQRSLNRDRALDIAHYLDDSKGSIPTNIVLSAQSIAEFRYDQKSKTIKYRRKANAFLVLDGQHRLYGYGLSHKPHRVPVAMYQGLTRQQEAKLFIDINTTQRGVPAALLLDIKQLAQQESETESRLRSLFDRLAADATSPLNGLLSPAKSAPGKISRVSFNRGAVFLLGNRVIMKLDSEDSYTLIKNYFVALESSLADPKLLRRSVYFEAFCEFFPDVLIVCRSTHGNYKTESLASVLAPLQNITFSPVAHDGSKAKKATILAVLKEALESELDVSGDLV